MKDRIVILVASELKKRVQIFGIENDMNITEVTETALLEYLERNKKGK